MKSFFPLLSDTSNDTNAAIFNQSDRPVAFFSRSLSTSERKRSSIEKEAQPILVVLRKRRHSLTGHNFSLFTT